MAYSTAAKNYMLDQLGTNKATYASLHTADPGDTGASEVTGGAPAYARKAITWNAAAAGVLDSSVAPVFDVPASTTVTHVGFWDAVTLGNWAGGAAVTNETFGAQGTYTLDDADLDLNS
jgi:hypothetical protein